MIYTVTHVHMELSDDRTHEHIAQVWAGTAYTRAEVVSSLRERNTWQTSAGGYSEIIHPVDSCPRSGCYASPYIRTNPNSVTADNLENLPRF
jgi:hypothetical protein